MAFEAYSVAIKLSLTNMVSSGLQLIAKDLTGLERNVVNLQDKFKALKMIGVGWGMKHVGDSMLGYLGKTVDVSKEYTHQVSQLGILGMKQAEIAKVISQSWKTSQQVISSSAADNIEAYREMRAVFGSGHEHEALAMLPMAQRSSAILSSLTGQMNKVKDVGYDMAKAAELTTVGGMTNAQMQKRAEQFMQASIAFGGKVNMQDFHGALKMTRGASLNYNDDFISHYLPTLIQEMKSGNGGGQQAGTLLRNFDRAVVQQVIPLNKLSNWEDAGLINAGHVVWNKHHTGLKKITPGGVAGQDIASQSPYQWWQQYGEAAVSTLMRKNGLTDIQAISALATNQMTADLFKKLHFQHAQFERDKKMIEDVTAGGGSKAKYEKLLKTDPLLAQQALHKQWENVQARIGYEILPKLIPLGIKFANWLGDISQWMEKHPNKLQALVIGFGSLAIGLDLLGRGLMAAGIIKLLGLGPMISSVLGGIGSAIMFVGRALFINPIGLAITGIAVAAYLLWRNWDTVRPKLLAAWSWITDGVASLWNGIKNGFHTFVGWYLQGWQGLFNKLIAGLNVILPKAMQISKMHFADDWNIPKASYSNEGRGAAVPVPPRQQNSAPQPAQLYITHEGKKVLAAVVTTEQTREASMPLTGVRGFDALRQAILPTMPSGMYPRG